jgi:hypothetical protein
MAYYIFLKSLRSLEEFRKNPHVKIPPKSPPTNFQSLGKFKNLIFIEKEFFSPNSAHSAQPACPLPRPWPAGRPQPSNPSPAQTTSPLGLSAARPARAFGVFYRRRFPLRFTPSRAGRLPLVSLTTGPRLSASSPTSSHPSSPSPPPIPGHRAPLQCR